jgi:DNA polymerase lambda
MDNNKSRILNALDTLRIRDLQSGEKFSAIAYSKAIRELKKLETIQSVTDVEGVAGVGKKIKEKIKEIIDTGELKAAVKAKEDLPVKVFQDLLNVYGIGPVKAKELIQKDNIKSIEDLESKPHLLNDVQKKGLKYYSDLLLRIPRSEMEQHEKIIMGNIESPVEGLIVGSYRREAPTSGDIDVLLKVPESSKQKEYFEKIIKTLQEKKYLIDILGVGDKKCLGVVKLDEDSVARRIDFLITPEKEFPYAVLYFTGSDSFNVGFRKYALTKGFTLNEHGMKETTGDKREVGGIKTEKDIFKFFKLKYIKPKNRNDESSIIEKTTKNNTAKNKNT